MRKLKLIWDFRGPDALKIAEHHTKHLKEYIHLNTIDGFSDFEALSTQHSIAFMVVSEDVMIPIRDALKPHRGQEYIAP